MKRDALKPPAKLTRIAQGAVASLALSVAVGAAGCLSRPLDTLQPTTTSTETKVLPASGIDKIDLLLMIDNSSSMADKQAVLAAAIPDLVKGLLNPNCVDDTGAVQSTPATPTEACPSGTKREFTAVFDVHIGIVSSSIGGHGDVEGQFCCMGPGHQDDRHGLITRTLLPDGTAGENTGWKGLGFLAWDPTRDDGMQRLSPPGIATFDDPPGKPDGLITQLSDLVTGTGQDGCGLEASLESWYRFLVDPKPYATINLAAPGNYVQQGTDTALLTQRADFLRSDSLLAVIMLTDENDCSIRDYGSSPIAANLAPLPRPRAACAKDPFDKCCASCAAGDPPGCPTRAQDANCQINNGNLTGEEDPTDLRCFNNRGRFGFDFLYPVERYSIALSHTSIPNPHPSDNDYNDGVDLSGGTPMIANPIYSDLQTDKNRYPNATHAIRDTGRVFIAGIVGVPWQDIANDPKDLTQGFKDSDKMNAPVLGTDVKSTWDLIIGDPSKGVKPADPHMVEQSDPRTGKNPLTGDTLAPVSMTYPGTDGINGHEWSTGGADLQYACDFVLPDPKDCSAASSSCDCSDPTTSQSPLCQGTMQVKAKGYPGTRMLSVLKQVGAQGIVGSICPAQLTDNGAADYGYRPAINGIINRLKSALSNQCLSKKLNATADGSVGCLIIEATNTNGGTCDCTVAGREKVDPLQSAAIDEIKADPSAERAGWNCFCEVKPLVGDELAQCLQDPSDSFTVDGKSVDGWCYVDPLITVDGKQEDSEHGGAITNDCPSTGKRIVRFIGNGKQVNGSTLFITCSGENTGG